MSEERDILRSNMNSGFETFPDWLKEPFEPMRDTLSILFDNNEDQTAYNLIEKLQQPKNWTDEQLEVFDYAKNSILSFISGLIIQKEKDDPLKTDAVKQFLIETAKRRME